MAIILLTRRQTLLWRSLALFALIFCFLFAFQRGQSSSDKKDSSRSLNLEIDEDVGEGCNPITADESKLRFLEKNFDNVVQNHMKAQKKIEEDMGKKRSQKSLETSVTVQKFPASNIYCYGKDRDSRTCRFRNICFDPKHGNFMVFKDANSIIEGNLPLNQKQRNEKLFLDVTSLMDHNAFYWDFVEVDSKTMAEQKVDWIEKKTFLVYRFLFVNIMHTIHDDILNVFDTLLEFADAPLADPWLGKSNHNYTLNTLEPFGKDHIIMFLDYFRSGETTQLFNKLTSNPLMFKADMTEKTVLTCFSDAIIGVSKRNSWYQYGFGSPQGPIPNKKPDGLRIRRISEYYMRQFDLTPLSLSELADGPTEERCIVIFSRTRDRLIVNEKDLAKKLEDEFSLPVFYIRMEDTPFDIQVKLISRAYIAIGMHGSLLIMGIFLPPGAILIELYPFAVPSINYTPYRTMASLVGLNLVYRAWENKHENNNVMYPDRSADHGGIAHLSKDEQQKILSTHTVPSHTCCTNPYWLFRIYQDTIVDIGEVIALIKGAQPESEKKVESYTDLVGKPRKDIAIAPIGDVECSGSSKNKLKISWTRPWNVVDESIDHYGVWIHQPYREYESSGTTFYFECESSQVYDIYVRTYTTFGGESEAGRWTPKKECKCP